MNYCNLCPGAAYYLSWLFSVHQSCLLTTKRASDKRFEDKLRALVDIGSVLALAAALVAASIRLVVIQVSIGRVSTGCYTYGFEDRIYRLSLQLHDGKTFYCYIGRYYGDLPSRELY